MGIGVIGIILSLILLMYLAYKGISVLILAPILACFAALLNGFATGDIHILATYTEVFMKSLGGYVMKYFPLFLLGAIFGKVMDDTGAAKSIANIICEKLGKKRAIISIVLACAILTYGGVSLFVVAFAVYPIAAELFREVGIPKRFIPGTIALGAFTFTMTALPGTPQIQNAIPMQFFGTDVYAAPILGIIASAIMFFGGLFWLEFRAKKAMAKGENYGKHLDEDIVKIDTNNLPNFWISMLPIIVVLIMSFILSKYIFPNVKLDYLSKYETSASKVIGNWSLIISLATSIIVAFTFNYKKMENPLNTLTKGVNGSFLAVMNTASEVGYGNVIAGLAAFAIVKSALLGFSSNPLISEAVSVSSLAGITGSASGGLSIALGALGEVYLKEAQALGISPEVLHRISAIACGGLDTLPHNGAVVTLLGVTGLTHKESYIDIGMCTAIIPTLAVLACIILGSIGIV
ncbi:GntP family permease [Fusobacterium nucleatum]|uniref:GntP family permease n=1 Tax=Fusobacterium nucleatum TaxID=851 RepID=UPI0030CFBE1E